MNSPETIEAIKNIRKLIAEDELDKAFDILSELSNKLKIAKLSDEVLLLTGQFSGLEKKSDLQVINEDDFQINKNRISTALINLLGQIEDESIKNPPKETDTPPITPTPIVTPHPNQSISKKLDYIFMGSIVLIFLTCIGGLVLTFTSDKGSIFSGLISMSGIFGNLFFMNSWRSKLGVSTVLATTPA